MAGCGSEHTAEPERSHRGVAHTNPYRSESVRICLRFFAAWYTVWNEYVTHRIPAIRNPYSEQWNLGVEHQFGQGTVISVAYVGSETHRLDVGGYYNTALTPGPGLVSGRNLYSYIISMMYDQQRRKRRL